MTDVKPDYGTEYECPKNENGHEPDWSTVTVDDDGGDCYLDVSCVHCGRSGCIGNLRDMVENLQW